MYYNPQDADGKVPRTPLMFEGVLEAIHGINAHDLIVPLLQENMSYREIAEQLSVPESNFTVSSSWVSKFVHRYYRKTERWERVS